MGVFTPGAVTVGGRILDITSAMVEVGSYYRVTENIHAVDILLGARYTDMETSVTLPVASGSVDESWWDRDHRRYFKSAPPRIVVEC